MRLPASIKSLAKKIQARLPFAISRNERYDRLTHSIILTHCQPDSVCIDIGANEGKILHWMIAICPQAKHFAFEPIPALYEHLKKKFDSRAHIFPLALSDQKSVSHFNWVTTNPALSGLRKRPYPDYHREKQIEVETDLLDHLIDPAIPISLIKIDVEGAEWQVLHGAVQTIQKSKPLILFECGKLGGDLYGYNSTQVFEFFQDELGYQIFCLPDWLHKKRALSSEAFEELYETGKEYYFLASPIDIALKND